MRGPRGVREQGGIGHGPFAAGGVELLVVVPLPPDPVFGDARAVPELVAILYDVKKLRGRGGRGRRFHHIIEHTPHTHTRTHAHKAAFRGAGGGRMGMSTQTSANHQ